MSQADIWKGPLSWEPAATSKPAAAAAAVGDKGGWILSLSIPAIHHVWDLQTGFYSREFWCSPWSPAMGLAIIAMGPVQRLGLHWWQGWTVDGMRGRAGAFHALERQLPPKLPAQFWPWQSLCWGNVRKRKEEREASARGQEQWALSQGER